VRCVYYMAVLAGHLCQPRQRNLKEKDIPSYGHRHIYIGPNADHEKRVFAQLQLIVVDNSAFVREARYVLPSSL
jgi:hypothetical protein